MPLKELRLGRCITFKQQDYQYLLNMLEKAFKEKAGTADESRSSGHDRPLSSNDELRGQGNEACPKSPSTTWMSVPTSSTGLTPKDEHLVRAINKVIVEKTRGFDFLCGTHMVSEGCVYNHFGPIALYRPWGGIRIHLVRGLRQRICYGAYDYNRSIRRGLVKLGPTSRSEIYKQFGIKYEK